MVDQRAEMRKQGRLMQAEGRRLTRRIHKAFSEDWKERARKAGEAIMLALLDGDARKAYGTLRAWHKECDPAASKPCYDTLEDQTRERVELYRKRAPPGDRIPSRAERPPLSDTPPTDEELRLAAKKANNGRSGGASKMQLEDLKKWLRGAGDEEWAQKKDKEGYEGTGDWWRLLVKLCEHIWLMEEVPTSHSGCCLLLLSLSQRAQAATTEALASSKSFGSCWKGFWMPGSRR